MTETTLKATIGAALALQPALTCSECSGPAVYTPHGAARGVFECLRCGHGHDARLYSEECQGCGRECLLIECELKGKEVMVWRKD